VVSGEKGNGKIKRTISYLGLAEKERKASIL
jgi:hypothetical protein